MKIRNYSRLAVERRRCHCRRSASIITKKITAQDKNIAVDFLCVIFRFLFPPKTTKSDLKSFAADDNFNVKREKIDRIQQKKRRQLKAKGDSCASFKLFTSQGNNEAIFRLV